jgi:outer membrane receptor protein involved in Fe transport
MSPPARLAVVILLCALAPAPLLADPAAQDISVTAPPAAVVPSGADPVTVIDSTMIERSGVTSLEELLEQIPALGAQGVNASQNVGGYGETFIDLRNLNFDRTVVLVDGRRFVASGIKTDEAVDLSNIPVSLIDHIDIYRDGSQPQWAGDAVAGVVNVVLKTHVQGVIFDAYSGLAGAGDDATQTASLVAGKDFASGFVTASLGISNKQPILQSDRRWAADPITSADVASGVVIGSSAAAGGHAIGTSENALALGNGLYRPFNPATDDYNFANAQDLQGGQTRVTGSLNGEYDFSNAITGFFEGIAADRRATNLSPPQTLGISGTEKNPDGFVIPATNALNPFGTAVDLERVVTEAGAQQTVTTGPTWRIVTGLKGSVDGVSWDVSYDHGESDNFYSTSNSINLTRALNTLSRATCPAASGCVLADWFGPDSLSPQAVSYIRYTDRSRSAYTEDVAQADFHANLFTLAGGNAKVSGGLDERRETGFTTVSAVTAAGDQAGPDAAPTSGGYNMEEVFSELSLPLLKDTPYVHALSADFSVRDTQNDHFGNLLATKETATYAPIPDVSFRATHGTAGRQPAISEAYAGMTAELLPVTDPCDAVGGLRGNKVVNANCLSQGLGPGFVQSSALIDVPDGGNPHLHPEQTENESLGAVLTPKSMPGLTLAVDWWSYRIKHSIDSYADTNPNVIPDTCYESVGLSSPLCSFITRVPGGANAGQISEIFAPDENVGTIKTSGIDFNLTEQRDLAGGLSLDVDWETSWLLDWRIQNVGAPGFTQYAGTFPGLSGVGLYPRIRSRLETTLEIGAWSLGWTGRYMSGGHVLGEDAATTLFTKARSVFYQDVSMTRKFKRFSLLLGIDNVTNQAPPTLVDGVTNTDTNSYDVVGIFLWGRVVARF